nr:hypothetical protein [Rhodococcus opacus]
MTGQRGVDLAGFDPVPTHFHLRVAATQVFEDGTPLAPGVPADDITAAIHATARWAERIGHESGGGECGLAVVAAGDRIARDVQLPPGPERDRLHPGVEHDLGDAVDRAADHIRTVGGRIVRDICRHGTFRRSVRVDESTVRRPPADHVGGALLPAGHDALEVVEAPGVQGGESRGGQESMGHPAVGEMPTQFIPAVDRGGHDHRRGSRRPREQILEYRRVEAGRREMRHPGRCGHPGTSAQCGCERVQSTVTDHHAFRNPGGPGRIDQVRRIVGADRGRLTSPRVTGVRCPAGIRAIDVDPRDGVRQRVATTARGEADEDSGIGEHVLDADLWIRRVDGQERGAGSGDGPDGED